MGWGGGFFGLLLFLVFIAAIVWVIFALASQRSHHHRHMHPPGSGTAEPSSEALRTLDERFALGEIGTEEYTERRDLLKGSS
jgi:uncharacterized membrane protein